MLIPRSIYNEEHQQWYQAVSDFVNSEIVPFHAQWEKDHIMPREIWQKAGQMGLFGLSFPEKFGGLGLNDFRYNAVVAEVVAKSGCSGPAIGFPVHADITMPYILHFGTEAAKEKYLPGMISGNLIGAIGMTEPGAGSDLQGMRTTAENKGDHYLLNGSKTFITNGYLSDIVVLAAKTDPTLGAKGISMFVVEAKSPGFSKGKPFEKVGMHSQDTCELFFDGVKIPKENLLGGTGQGFGYMMELLPQERLVVALGALAAAEGSLEHTIAYVRERKAFGKSIGEFQNTKFKVAEMATEVQIARVFMDKCVELHTEGKFDTVMASMAKYFLTDLQCKIIDECVQLHGGYGYMWEYFVARAYADARAQRIYAGSNEIMKELISRKFLR